MFDSVCFRSASSRAELFVSPCFRLNEFSTTDGTSSILLTPDRIVQLYKVRSSCKTMRLAVCVDIILSQVQQSCDHVVSESVQAHFAYFISLPVSQVCCTFFFASLLTFSVSTRGAPRGKSNKRISMKNVIFSHDFHEKSPFSRTICNETKCRILIECLIAADISNLRKTDIFVKATAKPFGSFSPLSGSQTDGGLPILRKFA